MFDWGQEHGTYFIVMEYVDGRTLAEILKADGPLPPERAVDVATDIAAALGHAHAAGVLHRDISRATSSWRRAWVKVADGQSAGYVSAAEETSPRPAGDGPPLFLPDPSRAFARPRSDLSPLSLLYIVCAAAVQVDSPVASRTARQESPPAPQPSLAVPPISSVCPPACAKIRPTLSSATRARRPARYR